MMWTIITTALLIIAEVLYILWKRKERKRNEVENEGWE